MKKNNTVSTIIFTTILLLTFMLNPVEAKFGKNKVQFRGMEWSYIQTPHFDIYFYDGGEAIAYYAADVAEKSYDQISYQLDWRLSKRVSILVYNSHNDFQQTNVTLGYLQEGIGGFTELFKNRVVLPFEGSYEQFRHVIHHELTHAVVNDLIFGGNVQSIVSGKMRVNIPLWLAEGYAEYSSLDWDSRADMIIRDAAINGGLPPIQYLNYYMAYKGGQSVVRYIGETFGVERIGEIFHETRHFKDIPKAIEHTLHLDLETLTEKWHFAVRKDYWPDIEGRSNLDDLGYQLTDHSKIKNYFNVSPAISPNGGKVAFLSDRSGYADVYVMSADNGGNLKKIVSGQRTAELEELKWLSPGLSWAPDNRHLVFAAKSGDEDALVFYDTEKNTRHTRKLGLDGIFTAAWSPDGQFVAFSGLLDGASDLFLYSIKTKQVTQLTYDLFADTRPAWSPDGSELAFVSDRGKNLLTGNIQPGSAQARALLSEHDFRSTDIYTINVASGRIKRITNSPGSEDSPSYANTTATLAYTSDRSGIWNIYFYDLATEIETAYSDIMTGIFQISWSKDDSRLVFAGYEKGGWDIFTINNPLNRTLDVIKPTLSNYLKRQNVQLDLTYSDTLPVPEEIKVNPFETHVFAYNNNFNNASTGTAPEPLVIETRDSTGAYEVNKYKTRFTVDLVDAQAGYSNFFGVQGNALMIFSDIMGNHRIQFGFELYRNLDNSDLLLGYDYLPNRTNLHLMLYNFPDDYISGDIYNLSLWHFRKYGSVFGLDYPFSKYSRLEVNLNWLNIYQQLTLDNMLDNADAQVFSSNAGYVLPEIKMSFDNVLYGSLYPIDGWRTDLSVRFSPDMPNSSRQFVTLRTDIRRYFKVTREYSFALRVSAASSHGRQSERFMAGGMGNWINYRLDNNYINYLADYEDLYFSEYVLPVRGAPYFGLVGNHYAAFNAEFRFPFIEYLSLKWPVSMVLGNVRGELFSDWVKTWDEEQIAGRSFTDALIADQQNSYWGTGFGMRMNLGIFVLRYDMAFDMSRSPLWDNRQHIWSLGLDF
ncbi:MAG: BamA/TamA family outer membrane protein [Candidatus Marinimicrobia bacterium]|nr:BamA/TamA family outer membrane protein [Candidatus Neomarinimicrobiota bacterium]